MSTNVYLEFSTDKEMSEEMVFAVSERLHHLGASLGVNSCFMKGSAEMTFETTSLTIAFIDARDALEREFFEFNVMPRVTSASLEEAGA